MRCIVPLTPTIHSQMTDTVRFVRMPSWLDSLQLEDGVQSVEKDLHCRNRFDTSHWPLRLPGLVGQQIENVTQMATKPW